MAKKTPNEDIYKMTVTFPQPVLRRLRERVAPRRLSTFIVQAVEDKLAMEEQLAAIEEAAGSWNDQRHPDMQTDADIDRWLADLSHSWNEHATD